jgi:hypothetical protein
MPKSIDLWFIYATEKDAANIVANMHLHAKTVNFKYNSRKMRVLRLKASKNVNCIQKPVI